MNLQNDNDSDVKSFFQNDEKSISSGAETEAATALEEVVELVVEQHKEETSS